MSHSGVIRDCRPGAKGFKRLTAGDFAIVDAPDLSRGLASRLIEARPAVVINLSAFSTGTVPNYGPQMLLDAGILLAEAPALEFKDGKKATLNGATITIGKNPTDLGIINQARLDANFAEGQQSLIDHMEAFFGNTIQFVHSESPLLIDGLGIPETGMDIAGRKTLVVSPGADIKPLRHFIREFNPIIIACDEAADSLVRLGIKPQLIVGNPAVMSNEALKCGASVILPADPDGHAVGLERIQDLGVGAMTFPAASNNATDLALLLAGYHDASLIVNCGATLELSDIFTGNKAATPSALIARQKVASRLMSQESLLELYTGRRGNGWSWFWALICLLICVGTICYYYL
ncbi:MAG: putative cytokinetic ring protein SteA [Corynebacterium sp.]|nr:putative cytokinetic ring protein SteA [Corynebacterium sp.]